jgi:hypothetical protein
MTDEPQAKWFPDEYKTYPYQAGDILAERKRAAAIFSFESSKWSELTFRNPQRSIFQARRSKPLLVTGCSSSAFWLAAGDLTRP